MADEKKNNDQFTVYQMKGQPYTIFDLLWLTTTKQQPLLDKIKGMMTTYLWCREHLL